VQVVRLDVVSEFAQLVVTEQREEISRGMDGKDVAPGFRHQRTALCSCCLCSIEVRKIQVISAVSERQLCFA
jgi:hypothetical protein